MKSLDNCAEWETILHFVPCLFLMVLQTLKVEEAVLSL